MSFYFDELIKYLVYLLLCICTLSAQVFLLLHMIYRVVLNVFVTLQTKLHLKYPVTMEWKMQPNSSSDQQGENFGSSIHFTSQSNNFG